MNKTLSIISFVVIISVCLYMCYLMQRRELRSREIDKKISDNIDLQREINKSIREKIDSKKFAFIKVSDSEESVLFEKRDKSKKGKKKNNVE